MTKKESEKNAYRTYCRERLVVSESTEKVDVEDTVEKTEEPKRRKLKKPLSLFMK